MRPGYARSSTTPLRAFLLLRYTLIAATAYLVLVENRFSTPPVWTSVLIALALLSNVLAGMMPSRVVSSRWFTTGFFLADTAWVTAALIASGRFEADFFFVYFFVLLLAAMAESLALIAVASVAVCIAYLYVLATGDLDGPLWASPSVSRLPFLFTAAGFYGYMIDRTRRRERRAANADEQVRIHGEALSTVSRQIRVPIASLLSWTKLLLETPLDGEQRRYAEHIRCFGIELLAIADGILDTAAVQAGSVPIEAVAFEPQAVVEEVCSQQAAGAREKELGLSHAVDPSVPLLLLGARSRVRQVLSYLVEHAIEASESGEVRVGARLVSVAPDDVQIRFDVTDTAAAMGAERQAALFSDLGVDDDLEDAAPAPGVDLTVCRRLVAAMRGEIGVESGREGGNVYWFTIRCGDVGATTEEPAADADPPVKIRVAAS